MIFMFHSSENTFCHSISQPVKLDLSKKLDPKQKNSQAFNIDAQGFRKTRNENLSTWEKGVTS